MTAPAPDHGTGYREVLRRLSAAQKAPAPGSPAYTLYVNRPVGKRFAALAYLAGMTPNAVTGVSALFTFSAITVLATGRPTPLTGVLVWVLLATGHALDSSDGMLARLRGGGSSAGEWLDHVTDSLKIPTLHLAVLVFAARNELVAQQWLLVPIGFAIVGSVAFFAQTLNDQLRRVHAAKTGASAERTGGSMLRRLLVTPTDYGVLCLSFVLLGVPTVFGWAYLLLFAAMAGHLTLALPKWYRDMRALSTGAAA